MPSPDLSLPRSPVSRPPSCRRASPSASPRRAPRARASSSRAGRRSSRMAGFSFVVRVLLARIGDRGAAREGRSAAGDAASAGAAQVAVPAALRSGAPGRRDHRHARRSAQQVQPGRSPSPDRHARVRGAGERAHRRGPRTPRDSVSTRSTGSCSTTRARPRRSQSEPQASPARAIPARAGRRAVPARSRDRRGARGRARRRARASGTGIASLTLARASRPTLAVYRELLAPASSMRGAGAAASAPTTC